MDTELKEYLDLAFRNIEKDLNNLGMLARQLDVRTNRMEIETSSAISALRVDVKTALDRVGDLSQRLILESEAREELERDIDNAIDELEKRYDKAIADMKESMAEEWRKQEDLNSNFRSARTFFWAIVGIVLMLLLTFIWQLIVNGGIKGIV